MLSVKQESRAAIVRARGDRIVFAGFLLVFYLLPPFLIRIGVIPFAFRFRVLVITTFAVVALMVWRGASLKTLGIRGDHLEAALRTNLWITFAMLAATAALKLAHVIRSPSVPQWKWFFVFYVFVSCPAQELMFRGALFAEMERDGITGRFWQVTISTMAFCFMHVIYKDAVTLVVSGLMGVVWGLAYYSHRNLFGVTVSHCLLGTASILTGLI